MCGEFTRRRHGHRTRDAARPPRARADLHFTSLPATAKYHYPFLPTHTFMRTRFDNLSKIGRCTRPVFFRARHRRLRDSRSTPLRTALRRRERAEALPPHRRLRPRRVTRRTCSRPELAMFLNQYARENSPFSPFARHFAISRPSCPRPRKELSPWGGLRSFRSRFSSTSAAVAQPPAPARPRFKWEAGKALTYRVIQQTTVTGNNARREDEQARDRDDADATSRWSASGT